jgi:hypothetical protein
MLRYRLRQPEVNIGWNIEIELEQRYIHATRARAPLLLSWLGPLFHSYFYPRADFCSAAFRI